MQPLTKLGLPIENDARARSSSALVHRDPVAAWEPRAVATAPKLNAISASTIANGQRSLREAALLIFCDPMPEVCLRLRNLSIDEWGRLLRWLDFSGLALYFFDRLLTLERGDWLPCAIAARLRQNLTDNVQRTQGMISESMEIQMSFQGAHLSYAVLKGVSLWPHSAARPELRSQFDLDLLVAERDAPEARRLLERRGYRLYAVSGRSWEFKFNERPGISIQELYKDLRSYVVELHLETGRQGYRSYLKRTEVRELFGMSMPVLSPVDLMMDQGLHVFKHLCGEFTRASHLVEFRRHVLIHRNDNTFWKQLEASCEEAPRAALGLGVVTSLITSIMGEFAPEAFTSWTVRRLPQSVERWIDLHGQAVVFQDIPGSKRYLFLQKELDAADGAAGSALRQKLLPLQFPLPVIRPFPNESIRIRLGRYRMQLHHILLRLRFHLVEGVRYFWHCYRWRRQLNRIAR